MALSLVLALLALAGACSGSSASEPAAQPTSNGTVFASGDFDGLPLPPRADPAGPATHAADATVQSFFVRNTTAEDVLAYYERVLGQTDGVTLVSRPHAAGSTTWRGSWVVRGRRLLVSATGAPTAAGGRVDKSTKVVTQLSLTLSDDAAPATATTTG
jgi:hypothetical protein